MSKLVFDIVDRLTQPLRVGDIESCERVVTEQMKSLTQSPFHIALDNTQVTTFICTLAVSRAQS